MKNIKRKLIHSGNIFANIFSAAWLLFATAPINCKLFANWLARAWEVDAPIGEMDTLIAEFEAIRASSAYAAFLTDCHILITALILVAEVAIIAGLVWLAWQNFRRLVWVCCK